MEFVIVSFPTQRGVVMDGASHGRTNTRQRVEAGTHTFDLGEPDDYQPPSKTVDVVGTEPSQPMEIAFTEKRLPKAARRRKSRTKATPSSKRKPTKGAPVKKPGKKKPPAKKADVAETAASISGIVFRTPKRTFQFTVDPSEAARLETTLQKEAMRWTYVLRNRERWSALPEFAMNQAERARSLLLKLGLSEADLDAVASERAVEVSMPFVEEAQGWEARIFPWEFVLAGATRKARHGKALTVTRQLSSAPVKSVSDTPSRMLYVDSAPGPLRDLYTFETERSLSRSNVRPKQWETLSTPTRQELRECVADFKPHIIHLAGFDSHQGMRLMARATGNEDTQEQWATDVADGYLLASKTGEPEPIDAEQLAETLCTGGHRPELIAFSLQNSAARIAPMAVANGAVAAIGFQDVFDDNLVELFFSTFYRTWRQSRWDLLEGFRTAWEIVRDQPASLRGSGLVLWSGRQLQQATRGRGAKKAKAPAKAVARPKAVWMPGHVPEEHAHEIVTLNIEPCEELNYSLLHNRVPLFKHFTLVNASADYKDKDDFATIGDLDVSVTLSAGAESASFDRRLSLDTTTRDLKDAIHLPLTSELMRSVHESINSTLLVEVRWGKVIHRDSHQVRLLPVDQWRDNDQDGQWLPSFVLPRDQAVTALVDKAQRYVRVLRDDPSAGFDGYQSVDSRAAEPAKEVDLQVQAIWSTIVHELNLGYINPPPTYNTEMDSQRLRTPSMIVKDRSGTCLDLAMLLAACCELIDVYPVIFLLKDHAFPGYWRQDAFHDKFIDLSDDFMDEMATEHQRQTTVPGAQPVPWWFRESAYPEILRQVKLGNLVPLESVWLTEHSGFWEAVDGGKDNLKSKRRFHSMLDIARARAAGVTPLPISVRS